MPRSYIGRLTSFSLVSERFGTDNVRDWFFPFGDGDMLDTALFGALAAHVHDTGQLVAGLCDGRANLEPDDIADLVLIPADSFEDAIARRPVGRVTVKAGTVVSGMSTLKASRH